MVVVAGEFGFLAASIGLTDADEVFRTLGAWLFQPSLGEAVRRSPDALRVLEVGHAIEQATGGGRRGSDLA